MEYFLLFPPHKWAFLRHIASLNKAQWRIHWNTKQSEDETEMAARKNLLYNRFKQLAPQRRWLLCGIWARGSAVWQGWWSFSYCIGGWGGGSVCCGVCGVLYLTHVNATVNLHARLIWTWNKEAKYKGPPFEQFALHSQPNEMHLKSVQMCVCACLCICVLVLRIVVLAVVTVAFFFPPIADKRKAPKTN